MAQSKSKRKNIKTLKNVKLKDWFTAKFWAAFWHEHSLSLVLAAITIGLKISGAFAPEGYWQDTFNGFGDDSWGAFLIIVCTKYFIERGSPESKD